MSRVNPSWVKFYTFAALLPLILVQAAGYRRPIRAEKSGGLLFGSGLGVLYSVTTISGPPLALALSNQGLAKREFRAALGLVRLTESTLTGLAYLSAGMIGSQSIGADPVHHPQRRLGVPAGRLDHQTGAAGNVPPHLYEFRCLDRRLWRLDPPARASPRAGLRRLRGAGDGRSGRYVPVVPILLGLADRAQERGGAGSGDGRRRRRLTSEKSRDWSSPWRQKVALVRTSRHIDWPLEARCSRYQSRGSGKWFAAVV